MMDYRDLKRIIPANFFIFEVGYLFSYEIEQFLLAVFSKKKQFVVAKFTF